MADTEPMTNRQSRAFDGKPISLDVLVVGGGPVGLITVLQIARNLPNASSRIRIIEKAPKDAQEATGRAITLFPRSTELLDQLDLADELAQQCFACRETVSYRDGVEVKGRGWSFMEEMRGTTWDFALVLRQKFQENVFRKALLKEGVELEAGVELLELTVDESMPKGSHRIEATIKDLRSGQIQKARSKYLVGADGGRSFVRRVMEVPFDGSSSEDKWVRIDGTIETDLPKPRTYCAIESQTHGNVLWAALDRGATRIGYAFTAERAAAYSTFDEHAAIQEAIAALKPFKLVFKQVDWWTVYVVGQRIARRFFVKDCVFLAGDACHTHSSGAAQGMNTGIHDAVNLGWKLSLVLAGTAKPEVLLASYEAERRPNVERLIDYDKDISRLMTMQLPEKWSGDPNADPNEVLGVVMEEAATFSSGLGIFYPADRLLNVSNVFTESRLSGRRVPDVPLQKPGTLEATRMHKVTPNMGIFYIVMFAGEPSQTKGAIQILAKGIISSRLANKPWLRYIIISTTIGPSVYELLNIDSTFAHVLYDVTGEAHRTYSVQLAEGAVYVLRPDGWIGTALELSGSRVVEELEGYFDRFMHL